MIVKFKEYKMVIWDFDGVIKESIDIKSKAFEKLFKPFGEKVTKRVKTHHEKNNCFFNISYWDIHDCSK